MMLTVSAPWLYHHLNEGHLLEPDLEADVRRERLGRYRLHLLGACWVCEIDAELSFSY